VLPWYIPRLQCMCFTRNDPRTCVKLDHDVHRISAESATSGEAHGQHSLVPPWLPYASVRTTDLLLASSWPPRCFGSACQQTTRRGVRQQGCWAASQLNDKVAKSSTCSSPPPWTAEPNGYRRDRLDQQTRAGIRCRQNHLAAFSGCPTLVFPYQALPHLLSPCPLDQIRTR